MHKDAFQLLDLVIILTVALKPVYTLHNLHYITLHFTLARDHVLHDADTVEQTPCTFSRTNRADDLDKLLYTQCVGGDSISLTRIYRGKTCSYFNRSTHRTNQ